MPDLNQFSETYRSDYLKQVNTSMLIEGAAGLVMIYFLFFDRLVKYHAVILAFAVMCHIMVYCHIQEDPEWIQAITYGFYTFYDELIILIGLMQMAVSYNGFTTALGNVQDYILRSSLYCNYLLKGLFSYKKRESK